MVVVLVMEVVEVVEVSVIEESKAEKGNTAVVGGWRGGREGVVCACLSLCLETSQSATECSSVWCKAPYYHSACHTHTRLYNTCPCSHLRRQQKPQHVVASSNSRRPLVDIF